MKLSLHILFLTFMLTAQVFAQTPKPAATPNNDDDVVKITTTLIQLDVSVTDNRGKVVSDLKPEDFEVYENGVKQSISAFSFISVDRNTSTAAKTKTDKNEIPPPPISNEIKPERVRRTIALVVDDLTLSFESVHFVRRALRKFVDEQMEEGDLVAIIRTGGGMGALQQFTFSKSQLSAAIDKVKWNPIGAGGVSAFAPIEATPLEQAKANGASVSDEDIADELGRLREVNQFRENIFTSGTLGAINYIIRGMKELPGRKSIMLLSDGFAIFSADRNGFRDSTRVLDSLRQLVNLANRSSVVVYSIDAKGLQTLGQTAADNTSALSANAIAQRIADRREQNFNSQEGLLYLSKETGGFAIFNNNDINNGIEKVLDDQSYYLLGYEPNSDTFDAEKRRFNKLEVKVVRKGLTVRYRSGFFGTSDEKKELPTANATPQQKIWNAISSPFAANDVKLSLNTIFQGSQDNKLALSSFVHVNTKDMTFIDETDGSKTLAFDVLAVSFGDNGVPSGQIGKTFTIRLKPKKYEEIVRDGLVYYFTFPVERPGAYQIRVALRDHGSNKVGSASQFTEVPNLKKKKLTLSGLAIENLEYEQWQKFHQTGERPSESRPLLDVSLRKFNRGTVLTYGFEVYNAKSKDSQPVQLEMRARVFYNGKPIYEGDNSPIVVQTNPGIISTSGALNLGTDMEPGDYVLQIVVTDKLAKQKNQIATQFVQFEIIE